MTPTLDLDTLPHDNSSLLRLLDAAHDSGMRYVVLDDEALTDLEVAALETQPRRRTKPKKYTYYGEQR